MGFAVAVLAIVAYFLFFLKPPPAGSAQVLTKEGSTVNLGENQAVIVSRVGKAGPMMVLPPTPNPLAPPAKAEVPWVPAPQVTAELHWEPVHGAQTYRVVMDYNVVQ